MSRRLSIASENSTWRENKLTVLFSSMRSRWLMPFIFRWRILQVILGQPNALLHVSLDISCLKRSFFCGLFSLAGWWWWGCCWYCPQCSYCSNFPLTCMNFFFQISLFCNSLGTPHKYKVCAQLNALEKCFEICHILCTVVPRLTSGWTELGGLRGLPKLIDACPTKYDLWS